MAQAVDGVLTTVTCWCWNRNSAGRSLASAAASADWPHRPRSRPVSGAVAAWSSSACTVGDWKAPWLNAPPCPNSGRRSSSGRPRQLSSARSNSPARSRSRSCRGLDRLQLRRGRRPGRRPARTARPPASRPCRRAACSSASASGCPSCSRKRSPSPSFHAGLVQQPPGRGRRERHRRRAAPAPTVRDGPRQVVVQVRRQPRSIPQVIQRLPHARGPAAPAGGGSGPRS